MKTPTVPKTQLDRIADLEEIQKKLTNLPKDKLMYIAGAIAAANALSATEKEPPEPHDSGPGDERKAG